jgi:hypothetical protein
MTALTALSDSALLAWRKRATFWLWCALCVFLGCGSSDDKALGGDGGAATGGSLSLGGSFGARLGSGGSVAAGAALSTGGAFSVAGAPFGGAGRIGVTEGGRAALGGSTAQAGIAGVPGAGPDGNSPYQRECHGETSMCVDVASLRCLGIREGTAVFGYSCSNPCKSDADCSKVPSSAEAGPACVDFVTQKHCLLVCLQQGKNFDCPSGMGCYVYPGATIGYCLWR